MGYREVYEKGLERIRSIGMEPYLDLGAETHSQNRLNRQHMDSFVFEMRVLDSLPADTSTTLFGAKLRGPIVAAAICESRILKRLAPWDPPRHLVVRGPYRHVRNPMISGVVFVLFGEALVLLSGPHAQWALIFLVINFIYIPLLEEQRLKARFGEEYIEYCRHVPRLLPRLRPWTPTRSGDTR